ncbi:hypothetical protein [Cohnella sp.]
MNRNGADAREPMAARALPCGDMPVILRSRTMAFPSASRVRTKAHNLTR